MTKKLLIAIGCIGIGQAADVTFVWDANPASENVLGYRLYEVVNDAPVFIGDFGDNELTATIDVDPGTHTYQLTAYNRAGESAPSEPVQLVMPDSPPSPPENVRTPIKITLQWSDDLKNWKEDITLKYAMTEQQQYWRLEIENES